MKPLMDITSLEEVWAFGYETRHISPCRDSTDQRPMFSVFAPAIPGIWDRRLLGYAHLAREVIQMVNQHRHWLRHARPAMPTPPEAA